MKKIIIAILMVLMLSVSSASAACLIDRIVMRPGVIHDFIDTDCNGTIDIVQEFRLINGQWVPTQWWYY